VTEPYIAPDGEPRCPWSAAAPEFLPYHDTEWGFPVADETRLFEKLSLEGFQSGLSWRTILAKREAFRAAFEGFDIHRVARFTQADVERLLQNAAIVRHRGKIEAVINNARRAEELREGRVTGGVRLALRDGPAARRGAAERVNLRRIDRVVQGTAQAGLEVRRTDHGLRVHAGHGTGQRPRRGMCDPGTRRTSADAVHRSPIGPRSAGRHRPPPVAVRCAAVETRARGVR
jgi:DNA-3-methyladenine glycosylase I